MAKFTSPRVDAAARLIPNTAAPVASDRFARADGLTVDEALELVAWLKESGYASIEVIEKSDCCSVLWSK